MLQRLLKHVGRDQMAAFLQTIISNPSSGMEVVNKDSLVYQSIYTSLGPDELTNWTVKSVYDLKDFYLK